MVSRFNKILIFLRLPFFLTGLAAFFAAERYFATEKFYPYLRYGGIGLLILGLLFTYIAALFAKRENFPSESRGWIYTSIWQIAILIGVALYIVYQRVLGNAPAPDKLITKALFAAHLLFSILGLFSAIGFEWAMRENGRGRLAEASRVMRAGLGYLAIGVLLAFFVTLNYSTEKRDRSFDWSYLKTSSPSEATYKMAGTLTDPLKVITFFPPGNEVYQQVDQYFSLLKAKEPRFEVTNYDKDLSPTKAEEYKVTRNGDVVLEVGTKRERIQVGLTLATARGVLKQFDTEFQRAFLALTAAKKTVYFSKGHGEMAWTGGDSEEAMKRTISILYAFLQNQNYSVRQFGLGEGSGRGVPDEATAVAIIGPTKPFLQEEIDVLKAYIEKGGKLLVMLDLEKPKEVGVGGEQNPPTDPLLNFLAEIGIEFNKTPLANDRNYVAITKTAVDHQFIFSNIFTSHESVTSLARHEEKIALLMWNSGYFRITPQLGLWRSFETVKTLPDTFVDANKNYSFDKDTEKRGTQTLGVAALFRKEVTKPEEKPPETPDKPDKKDEKKPDGKDEKKEEIEARVIAFASASAVSDILIRNPGNLLFASDAIKWLTGDNKITGNLTSEEDVKIQHTKKQDLVWFWGSVIAVPFLLIGTGFIATRRRKRRVDNIDKVQEDED